MNNDLPAVQSVLAPHYVIERHPQGLFASGADLGQWIQVIARRRRGEEVSMLDGFHEDPAITEVCPILLNVAREWAGQYPSSWERARWLAPVAEALVGSGSATLEERVLRGRARQDRMIDWTRRVYLPAWLDAGGLWRCADALRASPPFPSPLAMSMDEIATRIAAARSLVGASPIGSDHGALLVCRDLGDCGPENAVAHAAVRLALAYQHERERERVGERRAALSLQDMQSAVIARLKPMVEELQASLQGELVHRLEGAVEGDAAYERTHAACSRALEARIAREGVAP